LTTNTKAKIAIRDCPCGSRQNQGEQRYRVCCGLLHDGGVASSPEALMRSRWSAFALGLGAYLYDTLAANHPDRAVSRDLGSRELSRARERQRFLKLTVLHAEGDEVLFHAKVFEKGQDQSFAELSKFVMEDGAWRYESGVLVQGEHLPKDITTLDRAAFLALSPTPT